MGKPHVRFFSDLGYKKFLGLQYKYNIPLNPLTYGALKNFLLKNNFLPYTFQSGPTYLSTNCQEKYRFLDRPIASARSVAIEVIVISTNKLLSYDYEYGRIYLNREPRNQSEFVELAQSTSI